MTDKSIAQHHHATFEGIRQLDDPGEEFWSARDLAPLLEYQDWRNFLVVVEKARVACDQSGHAATDHFGDAAKMVRIGSGARRPVPANLFRATQTEEKLRRDQVNGKTPANSTHFEVGRKVRQTIQDLSGAMPENLPRPDAGIQQLASAKKKLAKKKT
jgi:hypothetical protein